MNLSPLPLQKFFDNAGVPLNGGKLFTYVVGTTTKIATYTDVTGLSLNTNPVILNFRGEANVWLDPTLVYKFVLSPASDTDPPTNPIWTVDNITAAFGILNLTQQFLGQIIYPRTDGEINAQPAAVIPSFYIYPAQTVARYVTNVTPGATDMASGIQQAIDSAFDRSAEVLLTAENGLSKPLLLRTTTTDSLSLTGNGRVSTILNPLSNDIKQSPQNINCLIFNQKNAGNLHLKHLRCGPDATAYTGIFLYCTENGGGDTSGQALLSATIEDCWFSFSSNNTGYFRGGFSNLVATRNVFEGTKHSCFRLEGAGNGDQLYIGNRQNNAFDCFIYGLDDTQVKALIQVVGHAAYQHQRGRLIEGKVFQSCIFLDIILEPDIANFGDTGVLKLTDSLDIIADDILMKSRTGVPRGAVCLEFINGATGNYSNVRTDALTGVNLSGTGALDLTFDDCDFTGCDNAFMLAGTLSGKIILRNCRLNNSQAYGFIVSSGTHSWDLTMIDCEIMNAGLRGTGTDRNIDISTSGKVRLIRCKFGQDNGSAAATFYLRATGSGTVEIIDPIIVGTPPGAGLFYTGAQVPTLDGVDSTMPGVPAFTPAVGGSATYTTQQGRWSLKNKTLTFHGRLTINAIGTGSATVVSGLPFTSHASINGYGSAVFFAGIASNVTSLGFTVAPAGTSMTVRTLVAAAVATGTSAVFQNAADVIFGGSYPVP
jgi:hypothetical protein